MDRALAFGAVAANAMLYPRVIVASTILNPAVVGSLVPYLAPPAAVAALAALIGLRASLTVHVPPVAQPDALQLGSALRMAALFQIVLTAVNVARETRGTSGVFTSAAVLGLTDVDALTVSMARNGCGHGGNRQRVRRSAERNRPLG